MSTDITYAGVTWSTQPDGTIVGGPSIPKYVPDASSLQWRAIATTESVRTGVPLPWILAIIQAESDGHPSIVAPDGGEGLMQITSQVLKQGLSNADVLIPANNIRLGADYLRTLRGYVDDLPSVASMYNGGAAKGSTGHLGPHVKPGYPWGIQEYTIPATGERPYISKVVSLSNALIASGVPLHPAGSALAAPPPDQSSTFLPIVIGGAIGAGLLWAFHHMFGK